MSLTLIAWVVLVLTLARLNSGWTRDVSGHLAGVEEVYSGSDEPGIWTEPSFPRPVWKFLQGSPETRDFNQPVYHCSNGTLYLCVLLTRYKILHLEDGSNLMSLPESCNGSVHIYKWWLLVKFPSTGCQTKIKTADRMESQSLKVSYFDRLLQKNITGTVVCEDPGQMPEVAPMVTCGITHVTVKLPHGSKLIKVKELDHVTGGGYSVSQSVTNDILFVEISKLKEMGSGFELLYLDSNGQLHTVQVSCPSKLTRKELRSRVRRGLKDRDRFNMWGFYNMPLEPFYSGTTWSQNRADNGIEGNERPYDLWEIKSVPEEDLTSATSNTPYRAFTTATPPTFTSKSFRSQTTTSTTFGGDYGGFDDGVVRDPRLFDMWGFYDIPSEPFGEESTLMVTQEMSGSVADSNLVTAAETAEDFFDEGTLTTNNPGANKGECKGNPEEQCNEKDMGCDTKGGTTPETPLSTKMVTCTTPSSTHSETTTSSGNTLKPASFTTTAGQKPDPLTTTAGQKPDPLTTPASPKPDPLTTPAGPKPDPLTTPASPKPDPLTTPVVPKPDPLTTPVVPKPDPLTTPASPKPDPLTTPASPKPDPLTTTACPKPDPLTTPASPKPDPLTTPASPKPDPLTTPASPKPDPLTTPASPKPDPLTTTACPKPDPLTTTACPKPDTLTCPKVASNTTTVETTINVSVSLVNGTFSTNCTITTGSTSNTIYITIDAAATNSASEIHSETASITMSTGSVS